MFCVTGNITVRLFLIVTTNLKDFTGQIQYAGQRLQLSVIFGINLPETIQSVLILLKSCHFSFQIFILTDKTSYIHAPLRPATAPRQGKSRNLAQAERIFFTGLISTGQKQMRKVLILAKLSPRKRITKQ